MSESPAMRARVVMNTFADMSGDLERFEAYLETEFSAVVADAEKEAETQKRLRYESNAELEKLDEAHEELKLKVTKAEKRADAAEDDRNTAQEKLEDPRYVWNVEDPCHQCGGRGRRSYGNTTGWRMRAGGCAMTTDVCDGCWGTGEHSRKGTDLRQMEGRLAEAEKLIADSLTAEEVRTGKWTRIEALNKRLAEAMKDAKRRLSLLAQASQVITHAEARHWDTDSKEWRREAAEFRKEYEEELQQKGKR